VVICFIVEGFIVEGFICFIVEGFIVEGLFDYTGVIVAGLFAYVIVHTTDLTPIFPKCLPITSGDFST